jgi:hypothetical protein
MLILAMLRHLESRQSETIDLHVHAQILESCMKLLTSPELKVSRLPLIAPSKLKLIPDSRSRSAKPHLKQQRA